jgi:hypothetical protein
MLNEKAFPSRSEATKPPKGIRGRWHAVPDEVKKKCFHLISLLRRQLLLKEKP